MPLLLQKNDKDELPLLPRLLEPLLLQEDELPMLHLMLEVDDNMLLLQEEERPLLPEGRR